MRRERKMFLGISSFFNSVSANSKVVIYGLGRVGQEYIRQISEGQFCRIVGVIDKKTNQYSLDTLPIKSISEIVEENDYDYILIAIENYYVANEVYHDLVNSGIRSSSILYFLGGNNNFPMSDDQWKQYDCEIQKRNSDCNNLYVAIQLHGGLGDHIVALCFCRRIMEISKDVILDVYLSTPVAESIFSEIDEIRNIFVAEKFVRSSMYDLVFDISRLIHVRQYNVEKIKNISVDLMDRITKHRETKLVRLFDDEAGKDIEVLSSAKMLGFSRYKMLGNGEVWNLTEDMSEIHINLDYEKEFQSLSLGRYITINNGADLTVCKQGGKQTKIWKIEYYEELCKLIHNEYKAVKIIQVGDSSSQIISDSDQAYIEKDLLLVEHILKNSMLHIDCEGGLVHMATQLGTKCLVLFGPTPVWFYGYDRNINLVASSCKECMGIVRDWYTECLITDDEPICMKSLTPEFVMQHAKKYIDTVYNED